MPTITRQQIKAVENRMRARAAAYQSRRGFRGLGRIGRIGQFEQITQVANSVATNTGDNSLQALINWLTGKTGELKITATQFAESMVKLMYGIGEDCHLPPPGLPIIPNNPTPTFCAGSVAGMIERCQTGQASNLLNSIKQQFAEKTRKNVNGTWVYQEGPYVYNWLQQYGNNDFSNLSSKIASAGGACGIGGGSITPNPIPGPGGSFTCPQNYRYNPTMERCEYVLPGVQTGLSTNTLIALGGFALVAMFIMKR